MTEVIRVLIADDHAIVREGLRYLVASEPGMTLVGEASDGETAVQLFCMLRPDVTLLDLLMPGKDGLEALCEIREQDPQARILVLTSFAEDQRVFPAIKAGALGYLLKDSSPQDLLRAIREVYHRDSYLSPLIARKVIQELHRAPELSSGPEPLSERELDVLHLIAEGLSNQEIADRLVISERTARNHVGRILAKLHLENRTQAALYAMHEGLAKAPPLAVR
jgi:NarL family two-component system response regulator LiaR